MIFLRFSVILTLLLLILPSAQAGRPLFTDDTSTINRGMQQIETWVYRDHRSVQHWLIPTFGILDAVEVDAMGVQGTLTDETPDPYFASIQAIQFKWLVIPSSDRWAGLAFSGAAIPPVGRGFLSNPDWEYFGYVATTIRPAGELLHLHANAGIQTRRQQPDRPIYLYWAVAAELPLDEKTDVFTEALAGDPYADTPGAWAQVGLMRKLSPSWQIDGTFGTALGSEPRIPHWVTVGVRWAAIPL